VSKRPKKKLKDVLPYCSGNIENYYNTAVAAWKTVDEIAEERAPRIEQVRDRTDDLY
jgi:hypothetical protein